MPDRSNSSAPATWAEAFAALPMSEPADRWPTIASRLGRRRTGIGWVALAATLVLAIALPWKLQHDAAPPAPVSNATGAPHGELETLYAQSAQLEALLAYARDDRVSSGTAATVSAQLDQRVASIDAALAQPRLTASRQRDLWRERVDALRTLASFETNRRLLSAQGEHYDGALVRVD